MSILRQTLTDNTALLYDLGYAHGKPRFPNLVSFLEAIIAVADDYDLITYTNDRQGVEANYLKQLGFTTEPTGNSRIKLHYINNKYLKDNSAALIEEAKKRERAENKALHFFLNNATPMEVGDEISMSSLGLTEKERYQKKSTPYFFARYNTHKSIFISLDKEGTKICYGDRIDGSWSKDQWVKCLYTEKEFEAKVQEFLNEA